MKLDIQLFASSGDFGTITWGSPPYTRYHLVWSSSQNITENYDLLTATLYYENYNSEQEEFYKGITIGGITYNDSSEYKTGSGVLSSVTLRVYHNDNGIGSISIKACQGALGGTAYFNNITRYVSFTDTHVQWVTIDKASFYVRASDSCNWCRYYLNGSSSWVDVSNVTSADYAFNVENLPPNTTGFIEVEVRRSTNGLWTKSGRIYYTTNDYGHITSTTVNSNSDTALRVTSSAPQPGAGYHIYIELLNSGRTARIGDSIQHDNTLDTTFSIAELQSLANYIPNNTSANFRINVKTIKDGKEWIDYKDGTYSVVNANPTFSTFTFQDTNSKTINLTGNNQKIIKGYSNIRATVSTSNKAIARKGATMKNYQFVVGSKQSTKTYSSSADVIIDLSAIDNNVFMMYAIDSRNNSTVIQKSPSSYIDYFKPIIPDSNIKLDRENSQGNQVTLSFNGTFFNSSFGNSSNTLTASYKYKKTTSTTWITGDTPITLTKNGNNFSYSGLIKGDLGATGFNWDGYNIQIVLTDLLEIVVGNGLLSPALPNMAMDKDGVAINAPYDSSKGGDLQASSAMFDTINNTNPKLLAYPVGAYYFSNVSTSPASLLGGTWVQLKDRFLVGAGGSYSNGSTSGSTTYDLRHKHTVGESITNTNQTGGSCVVAVNTNYTNVPVDINKTGDWGASFTIIPPNRAAYMWYRSA